MIVLTRRTTLIAALTLPGAAGALAHGYVRKSIAISHPWTFAQDDAARRDCAIGMGLRNSGAQEDRLTAVETQDAAQAQIVAEGGVIVIPARGQVQLHAGGPHVRLSGLRRPLIAYDNLFVTLAFARAGRFRVEVVVEDRPA